MQTAKELRTKLASLYVAGRTGGMTVQALNAHRALLSEIRKSAADQVALQRQRMDLIDIPFLMENEAKK